MSSTPQTAASQEILFGHYGVYGMVQQWMHDQVARPRDQIVENFLGKPPMEDGKL